MHGTPSDGGANRLFERESDPGPPATEYDSKMVMLRAERDDRIQIVDVVTRLSRAADVPPEATVQKRTTPYFGPKIVLATDTESYLLTAPGPETQLLLWAAHHPEDEGRRGWTKIAEVTAQFAENQPQYDLCPECGQPMQTIEHERKAAVGRCPGSEVE